MADDAPFDIKSNLRQVLADLKEFDPKLATAVRRQLRQSGDEAIRAMGDILDSDGPSTPRRGRLAFTGSTIRERAATGARDDIKRGLKLRVTTGKARTSIRLTSTTGDLRKAMNAKSWRHPTFGHDPYVEQAGSGYFNRGATAQRPALEQNLQDAITVALDAIATRSTTLD